MSINESIGQGAAIFYLIIAILTPIAIVVTAVRAFRASPPPRAAVVMRGVFALGIWLVVTIGVAVAFLMVTVSLIQSLPIDRANQQETFWAVALMAVYAAICGLLCYWAGWKRKVLASNEE